MEGAKKGRGRTGEVQTEEKKANVVQSAVIWSPVPPEIICETKRLFGSFTEKIMVPGALHVLLHLTYKHKTP